MERLCGQPSLELGVRVVRVAGFDPADHHLEGAGGTLFVRYYVPAGDGRRRLRVDTREVPCAAAGGDDGPCWGELARFERWGSSAPGAAAVAIAFELRWRPRPSLSSGLAAALLGAGGARRPASRVLARAELAAWPAEGAAATERWLALASAGRRERVGQRKALALRLLVGVSAAVVAGGEGKNRVRKPGGGASECCGAGERCGQCGWVGSEEDMFLAATFAQ